MKPSSLSRTVFAGSLCLAAFSACGVDDRALSYEYHALEPANSSAGSGSSTAGASGTEDGADAGASAAGEGGVEGDARGGESGRAAAPGSSPGGATAGGSSEGGTTSGGTSATAGAPSGGTTPAGGADVGAGGSSGSSVGPCGDLNNDLVDDCTETLVTNSRFDSDAAGWDAEPMLTATWAASDASNKLGSGSLLLDNTAAVADAPGSIMIGAHQCIPATADNYDVAARIMLGAGQAGGAGGINVWMFDDDACKGNVVSANTPISGGTAGQWVELSGTLSVPGDAHSLLLRVVAIKPFSQADLKVSVDDVLVAKH